MRDVVVVEYLSVDGVIQAPGYEGEDSEGRLRAGWVDPTPTWKSTASI